MFYKEIDFEKQKPIDRDKRYFYYTLFNYSWIGGYFHGNIEDMAEKIKDKDSDGIYWLQPEEEYDPKSYYKRL